MTGFGPYVTMGHFARNVAIVTQEPARRCFFISDIRFEIARALISPVSNFL